MARSVRPSVGASRQNPWPYRPLARLAPHARFPSWPGALGSSTKRPKIRLQSLPSCTSHRHASRRRTAGRGRWYPYDVLAPDGCGTRSRCSLLRFGNRVSSQQCFALARKTLVGGSAPDPLLPCGAPRRHGEWRMAPEPNLDLGSGAPPTTLSAPPIEPQRTAGGGRAVKASLRRLRRP